MDSIRGHIVLGEEEILVFKREETKGRFEHANGREGLDKTTLYLYIKSLLKQ